jgi:hypothetical protein
MFILTKKTWKSGGGVKGLEPYFNTGWFLFGFIPLYRIRERIVYKWG